MLHLEHFLDKEAIITAAKNTGAIVTAEEHLHHGGLNIHLLEIIVSCLFAC